MLLIHKEMLVAITVGFAAVFALLGGMFNNWKGRRVVILSASFIFLLGSVLLAAAYNKYMLLIGRAIVGAGIGKFYYCGPYSLIHSFVVA